MNDVVRVQVNWWITVVAIAAIGVTLGMASMYAWSVWRADDPLAPVASLSPSPQAPTEPATVPVMLDLESVRAPHPFGLDRCYAPWRLEPTDDAPVTVTVEPTVDSGTVSVAITFTNTTDQRQTFLGHHLGIVIVEDGRVVSTLGWDRQDLMPVDVAPGESVTMSSPLRFTRASLCSHADRYNALAEEFAGQLGEDQIAEFNRRLDELDNLPRALPSGEYTFYAWTPMVWGDQAAVAQAWLDAGVEDIQSLRVLSPDNPLLQDPRLGKYCSLPDVDNPFIEVAFVCATVPAEVWEAVLTREVLLDSINPQTPLVAVSQPVTVTVE